MPVKSSRDRSKNKSSLILKMTLLVIGTAVILGLLVDLNKWARKTKLNPIPPPETELQNIILESNPKIFKDVNGLFKVNAPTGFDIAVWPNSTPYNVTFQSRNGPSIAITATRVEYNSMVTLRKRVEAIQRDYGLNMNIVETNWNGRAIIQRTTILHAYKVLTLDFVENYVGHNIQISVPHLLYDRYAPVLLDLVSSYTPLDR